MSQVEKRIILVLEDLIRQMEQTIHGLRHCLRLQPLNPLQALQTLNQKRQTVLPGWKIWQEIRLL